MSAPALAQLQGLPEAVARLLDAFDSEHPGACVRIWQLDANEWRLLYPPPDSGAGVSDAPAAQSVRRSLGTGDGCRLELEILGIDEGAETRLLGEAVAAVLGYDAEARSAARELAERYEEINLLYSISEILGSILSVSEASARILDEVVEVMGARRASLWVYSPEREQLNLAASVGEEGLTGPIPVDDPSSVTAEVFRERQAMNLERDMPARLGTRLDPRPREFEPFLSVPIQYTPPEGASRTVGVITLVGHRSDIRFSAGDARLLAAIASQVGAALETHRLVAESLSRERTLRELELAHDLQLKLLPPAAGLGPSVQAAARCAPADSVGGDFYHLFRLSRDRVGVVIGDVSGHGFSAALIMALTMSAVGIYAREVGSPGEVLRRVHGALIGELESTEMYLTLFYGVLDPPHGRLVYANAGHPHAFRVLGDGSLERLATTDPPLGTLQVEPVGESRSEWVAGEDLLCLFTDGLSDLFAREPGGGEHELLELVVRMRDRHPDEILDRVFSAPKRATTQVPPDDRTAVLVRG